MNFEVFNIIRRKHPPGKKTPDLQDNFVLERDRQASLDEFFTNPNLSLYTLDHKNHQAAFVSTAPGVDLTQRPFFYLAQYDVADQIWLIDYDALHRLADKVAPICEQTLLIYSVGRCGSTLLSSIFREVDLALSVSEPDVFTQIAALHKSGQIDSEETLLLLRTCWKLIMNERTGCRLLVIKLRSEVTTFHEEISRAIPEAFPIFMYRGAEAVIGSYDRIWGYPYTRSRWLYRTPLVSTIYRTWRRLIHLRNPRPLEIFRPLCPKSSPIDIMAEHGLLGYFMLEWLLKVNAYLALRKKREDAVAVRYEDLVNSPEQVVRELFRIYGIPDSESEAACAALKKDSQKGTSLARVKSAKRRLDAKDRETIRRFFAEETQFASPDVILPGTLIHIY